MGTGTSVSTFSFKNCQHFEQEKWYNVLARTKKSESLSCQPVLNGTFASERKKNTTNEQILKLFTCFFYQTDCGGALF